jgi:myo-inositol 2-dehydrogenase/D-chiro-inositol 1-dehydrogenase
MAYFVDRLNRGIKPRPDVRDALESLRVALAATRSLKAGRAVKVSEI